ncbi:MAG: Thioesterase family protein [Parcubacteria group bacterium GW2011_GWA2_45_30]|nr:MAG: Thioesterase family protein [Parcubacteria group bacterium GW2011_GWA2_45_30]
MLKTKAFQDYFPGNRCFGCGPSNPIGHRIKSFWYDELKEITVCIWQPQLWFAAATPDILHGGTSGSLIDCHAIWTAMATRYKRENRAFGSPPYLWWDVTRNFSIDLMKKVPTDQGHLEILAKAVEMDDHKAIVEARIMLHGEEKVFGRVVAVSTKPSQEMMDLLLHPSPWFEKMALTFKILKYLGKSHGIF